MQLVVVEVDWRVNAEAGCDCSMCGQQESILVDVSRLYGLSPADRMICEGKRGHVCHPHTAMGNIRMFVGVRECS